MQRRRLTPHHAARPEVLRLHAEFGGCGDRLSIAYFLEGDTAPIAWPEKSTGARADNLWRATCFEAFVRAAGGEAYVEFNFSPSTNWAAYRFTAYRTGMAPCPSASIRIRQIEIGPRRAVLIADAHCPALGRSGRNLEIGLSAIIRTKTGETSYWALAHPGPKPDFHHSGGFVATLTKASLS